MRTIKENVIEDYLQNNSGKKLSLRKICKELGIKRRKAIWLAHQSSKIRQVNPLEVGSGKHYIHVYTYQD